MIKSPCKDCERHKKEFPICFDDCLIIKQVQKHDGYCMLNVNTNNNFNESDTFGIANYSNKNKCPALS